MTHTGRLIVLVLALAAALAAAPPGLAQNPAAMEEGLPEEFVLPEVPLPRPTAALDAPVDRAEYVVGPDDVFALKLWGEINAALTIEVTPEGNFVLPVGGPITVVGLSIDEAAAAVRARIDEYYVDIDMTLTLIAPRELVVHVTGAVLAPGQYTATAATRVSAVIALAGGILEEGSQRTITLSGFGGRTSTADLVKYRNRGDLDANPLVMIGSQIHVPFRARSIEVVGAVNLPGTFELVEGDSLLGIVELAGGVRPDANMSDVELVRFAVDDPLSYTSFSLDLTDADPARGRGVDLEDGDRVFVRAVEHWHEDARVEVIGEVVNPGTYSVAEGEDRLTDVIARAGGFTPSADLTGATLRRGASGERETAIDRAVALMEEGERGALTEEEASFLSSQRIELADQVSVDFPALFLHDDATEDVLLLDGDILDVPRALHVVRVSGAVHTPGFIQHAAAGDVDYYVDLAGGYTSDAYESRVRIVKANSGSRLKPSSKIAIEPGDTVWVPRTPDRDWWEITKEVLLVAAQVATIYLVVYTTQN